MEYISKKYFIYFLILAGVWLFNIEYIYREVNLRKGLLDMGTVFTIAVEECLRKEKAEMVLVDLEEVLGRAGLSLDYAEFDEDEGEE